MPNNRVKKDKYLEVTFQLTDGVVISKRVDELNDDIDTTVRRVMGELDIDPFVIKEIGVECVSIKKMAFQLSKEVINSIVTPHISSSVEEILH